MTEERRVVTTLFADVAGSTALGESLDPEDARILLRRYYEIARETVAEYGGIMEKFIGDAVVAVCGSCPLRARTAYREPQGMEAGLAVLERVGDQQQLGRFERLQVG